jgi:hypothetical protein
MSLLLALFANSLRCNGASAVGGKTSRHRRNGMTGEFDPEQTKLRFPRVPILGIVIVRYNKNVLTSS